MELVIEGWMVWMEHPHFLKRRLVTEMVSGITRVHVWGASGLSGETQCAQVCSFSSCRHRLMGIRFSHKFSWGKKRPGREIREVLAQSYLLNGFFIVFHEACTELLSFFKFLFWHLFPFSLPPQFSHSSRKSYLWKTSVTLAEITSSNDFNIQMDNIFSNRLGVA